MSFSTQLTVALACGTIFATEAMGAEPAARIQNASAAMSAFKTLHPKTRTLEIAGRTVRVYGQAFSNGTSPQDTAERFRWRHAPMFGVAAADLDTRGPLEDGRHMQGVMYDPITGTYKFTMVYYTQKKSGIPVFRADLRLLVRNELGYPLVLAANGLRGLGAFVPAANAARNAANGRNAAIIAVPALINFSPPELVIWAGVDDANENPTVAYQFTGDSGNLTGNNVAKWLFVTDADTGQILYQEDQLLDTNVEGNVSSLASEGPGTDVCEEEVPTIMPYARVNIVGGAQAFADADGDFVITNGGTSQVTVQSPVRGLRFVVTNLGGPNTVISQNVIPPGPADFVHNAFNNSEFMRAEVNAYVSANIVRDVTLLHNPTYPTVFAQTEFGITVNEAPGGFCPGNAQYQGNNLRFCASSGSTPNTAWSSVVYHEYGHHLVATGGSGQGAYGEGLGDVMSVIILDDPRVGVGFFGNCNGFLRTADNSMQYPCSGPIHTCGTLLSGCVWDTIEELTITNPDDYIDIISNLAINAILLHGGSGIAPDITLDYLTLDDDDGNILNGTPHSNQICFGFGLHNMDCPPLEGIGFEYPNGLPETLTAGATTTISVNVVEDSGVPGPGTGLISYRIAGAGGFTTEAMSETLPNEYEGTLPAADCGDTLEYYFTAQAENGQSFTDPPSAPTAFYAATAVVNLAAVYNFENPSGWTVSGNATDGQWGAGVPVGGGDRGDPPTDYDGSGQCFLTDNVDGDSDVDGGSTTLTSPVIDLTGFSDPQLSYARWFSNTEGGTPLEDVFVVEVSSDGGSSWTNLETVGPAGSGVDGDWFLKLFAITDTVPQTNQFRIRFTAEDAGAGSIVEAGVDAVAIFDCNFEPTCKDGVLNQGEDRIDCGGPCPPCECLDDATCDDDLFCNGAEPCDSFGFCAAGTPPCQGPNSTCLEDSDTCVNCTVDADCDDTRFCTGVETCVDDLCQPGIPVDCGDGVDCTTDSCNELDDVCEHDPDDSACDNGLFCDGVEVCDVVADCITPPDSVPDCDDGVGCTVDTCDEDTDLCGSMADDRLCADDGLFCNGDEFCDAILDCQNTGTPCNGVCDESADLCVCDEPLVQDVGGRYVQVQLLPPDSPIAQAIHITPTCPGGVTRYVGAPEPFDIDLDGFDDETIAPLVDDIANAAYHTPQEWGELYIYGESIAPDTDYEIASDCGLPGEPELSDPVAVRTWLWGDAEHDDVINLADAQVIVLVFQGVGGVATLAATDLEPCLPNRSANLGDVQFAILAFQGGGFEVLGCASPCP